MVFDNTEIHIEIDNGTEKRLISIMRLILELLLGLILKLLLILILILIFMLIFRVTLKLIWLD